MLVSATLFERVRHFCRVTESMRKIVHPFRRAQLLHLLGFTSAYYFRVKPDHAKPASTQVFVALWLGLIDNAFPAA